MRKYQDRRTALFLFLLLAATSSLATGCAKKTEADPPAGKRAVTVAGRAVKDLKTYSEELEYAAIVVSDQEAKIIAKTSGNIKGLKAKVGDKVAIGQVLAKIDDVGAGDKNYASSYNANQIKQASLAVEQAQNSYQLAQKNYQNLLASSEKDLAQLEIARNQAAAGQENVGNVTSESQKSAEIAYEQAKLATENARLALENKKKQAVQSDIDTDKNAGTTADTVADLANSIIVSINNIAALDPNSGVSLPYQNNLSVKRSSYLSEAKTAYLRAKELNEEYLKTNFTTNSEKIDAASELVQATKQLADYTKLVFDNTISSDALPQSSSIGPSLTGLQSQAAGFQSQINSAIAQINGAKQSLANSKLGNDATLDALQKAYELAQKQEAAAKQNLANIKAGNKSQNDQARFGQAAASNQYEATKTKLDSQISVSLSQVELARLQYQNAVVSLQSLYDVHQLVSPIDGTVIKLSAKEGETVSAGQVVAVVSQSEKVRLQFYVDQDNYNYLKVGQKSSVKDNDGKTYSAKISSITPQADSITKRFLVEIIPDTQDAKLYVIGTVMNVSVPLSKTARESGAIILPLSAIEINQTDNTVFFNDNGKAKKAAVTLLRVEGETVEIKTSLGADSVVIVKGNKLVKEGDPIDVNLNE